MWRRLIQLLTGRTPAQQEGREADVQEDRAQVDVSADSPHVGRIAGDDPGYAGETGAERRAEQAEGSTPGPDRQ
jgi:hypothetical protein